MSNNEALNNNPHTLRKEGKFKEAIPLYEKGWTENKDKFYGAGLIHCFRKENNYIEALRIAMQLKPIVAAQSDFTWGKIEIIWALIKGKLDKLPEDSSLESLLSVANEIMSLNPEDIAAKMVVFGVMKKGKESRRWDIVSAWADKLDPAKLSTTPITLDNDREGWSDQARWYNFKGKALIKLNMPADVLLLLNKVINKFPKQKKTLLHLKALAFHNLGQLSEAKQCYKDLCAVRNPDWWLVQGYAKLLIDEGNKQQALKLMCQAALSKGKLEAKVALFHEIGLLLKDLGMHDAARAHLSLSALIRQNTGWPVPQIISNTLKELNIIIGDESAPKNVKEALSLCGEKWEELSGNSQEHKKPTRKPRRGLHGRISLGPQHRKFCFIIDDKKEFFFCIKSDLPEGATDGAKVNFNALPTIDRSKNRESWKSVDISLLDNQ